MVTHPSVRIVFHSVVFILFLLSFLFDFAAMDSWDYSYIGRMKFVTFWNMVFQVLHSGVCVVVDIQTKNNASPVPSGQTSRLHRVRDFLHTNVVYPFGTFCTLIFWAFFFRDRELVYPRNLDSVDLRCSIIFTSEQLIRWKDVLNVMRKVNSLFIKHTLTLFAALFDKLLVLHRYPSLRVGVVCSIPVPLGYSVMLFYLGSQFGIWVYPFMKYFDFLQKLMFIAVCLAVNGILHVLGNRVTAYIWRSELNRKKL